jgi:hypothetical protein
MHAHELRSSVGGGGVGIRLYLTPFCPAVAARAHRLCASRQRGPGVSVWALSGLVNWSAGVCGCFGVNQRLTSS